MTTDLEHDQVSRPPTLLPDGGPLLSFPQFSLLLSAAKSEGLSLDVEPVPTEVWEAPEFQRDWQELLAAIALYGPARVVLPEHLAAEIDIQPLLEREIAEILILERAAPLRAQISRCYDRAFEGFRKLEWTPGVTPMVSLDEPLLSEARRLKAELLITEAESYAESLRKRILDPLKWLHDIFGYYVENNEDYVRDSIADFHRRVFRENPSPSLVDPGRRAVDLMQAMGLYVRDRGQLEGTGWEQRGIGYNPSCLREFSDLDRRLTSVPDGFGDQTELQLRLSVLDRDTFLTVHAFWSTFFQLVNLLQVGPEVGSPLHIPSVATVRSAPSEEAGPEMTGEGLRIYELFLSERGRLPTPSSLRDVERLRRDPGLSSLRSMLAQWTVSSQGGDGVDDALQIRADINLAAKRLRRSEWLGRVGRLITFVSLPITAYEAMQGTALGLGLTPIGAVIEGLSTFNAKRASWMRFGAL